MARRVAVLAAVAAAGTAGASAWLALSPRPAPEGLPRCEPPGMRAGPVERFGPDTLSDKINGRADFFLDAGFVGLTCAVVASGTDRDLRFEACDYDMGSFRGAFSVYSRQVRPEADEHGDDPGYDLPAEGSSFFVQGSHYVEVVGAPGKPALMDAVRAWTACYRGERQAAGGAIAEAALLPDAARLPGSLTLYAASAFGFDRLDGVVAARYAAGAGHDPGEAIAFVSVRGDAAEAARLADALVAFLVENGGTDAGAAAGIPGARIVHVLEAWNVVLARGRVLAGVHDAPDRASAEALAAAVAGALDQD